MRNRACGAILKDGLILMVRHRHRDGREYWTLPGGAVEPGETFEQAAVREMREETKLDAKVSRLLFEHLRADGGIEKCFLLELIDAQDTAALGHDPEESALAPADRLLQELRWFDTSSLQDDVQVRLVMDALGRSLPM